MNKTNMMRRLNMVPILKSNRNGKEGIVNRMSMKVLWIVLAFCLGGCVISPRHDCDLFSPVTILAFGVDVHFVVSKNGEGGKVEIWSEHSSLIRIACVQVWPYCFSKGNHVIKENQDGTIELLNDDIVSIVEIGTSQLWAYRSYFSAMKCFATDGGVNGGGEVGNCIDSKVVFPERISEVGVIRCMVAIRKGDEVEEFSVVLYNRDLPACSRPEFVL